MVFEVFSTELSESMFWIWATELDLDLSLEFTPGPGGEVDVAAKFSSLLESNTTGSSTSQMGVVNRAR
jgi:hypothetical protein